MSMSAVRACLQGIPKICDVVARKAAFSQCSSSFQQKTSILSSMCARNFSVSSLKRSEQTFNFNVQDEEDFQKRVDESKTPVVVDFHAEWCGPCKQLGPKLEKAVDEHKGKILLAKVDVDDLSEIAMRFQVRAVPTVVGIKDGQTVDKFEGNLQESDLKAFLNRILQK